MSVLELVVNSLAALGAVGAAIVALVIAGQASRSRDREHRDAAEAQARLVQVEVVQVHGVVDFYVRIHNYGDRAIIGAAVTAAWFWGHPEYTWRHRDIDHDRERIVRPAREIEGCGQVRIQFLDGAGEFVPKEVRVDDGQPVYARVEPPGVVVTFMDADGTLWQTGTSIPPQRIESPPTSLDPGGPMTK